MIIEVGLALTGIRLNVLDLFVFQAKCLLFRAKSQAMAQVLLSVRVLKDRFETGHTQWIAFPHPITHTAFQASAHVACAGTEQGNRLDEVGLARTVGANEDVEGV